MTIQRVSSEKKGGWWTRVIPNFSPVFQVEGDLGRSGEGMYDRMNSIGANEIIIESPEHATRPEDMGIEQMARVLLTYRERMTDLEKDPRLRYTLIYKNAGKEAGAVYSHPISHLASTPVIPKRVKEELDGAKEYFAYKERCIFCDIAREELSVGKRVLLETRNFVSFCPYASKFPFESWIIPKRHHCAFQDIGSDEIEDLAAALSTVLKKLRTLFSKGLAFNYFIHSAPNRIPRKNHWHTLGEDYHWHLEIMPRLLTTSGFEWGSGFYVLPTSPEDASKYLREV
jgi:UDPglucose--hexose-1-phosphate uridylyltransferase